MQYRFPVHDVAGGERELIAERRGTAVVLTVSGLPGSALGLAAGDATDLGILLTALARFGRVDVGFDVDGRAAP